MALSRRNTFALLLFCGLAFSSCGGSRAVFRGRPKTPFAQAKKKTNHPSGYAKGKGDGKFIWPLHGPINSPYGERHGRVHDGIDIGGDEGERVVAAADGDVVYDGKLGGYGNLIVVRHPDGFFTAYAHNKKNLVDNGEHVKQGQVIAKVGRSGNASGDHLHFEIRDDSGTYDPLDFLPQPRYSAAR